jgi:hypothetical protein
LRSDPYQRFRDTAAALEAEGVDVNTITDALVSVGLGAACKLGGRAMVITYLHRLLGFYETGPERQAPPRLTQ